MSDINVKFPVGVQPEEVKKVLATMKKLVAIGQGLSKLTKTDLDDKVLEYVEKFLLIAEPHVTEEWFANTLNWIIDLFDKDPVQAVATLKALGK